MSKSKVRIELDHAGIEELLRSAEIAGACKDAAYAIAGRAGDGFEVVGPQDLSLAKRAGYGVVAVTYEARLAEAEDKVLSKAVR